MTGDCFFCGKPAEETFDEVLECLDCKKALDDPGPEIFDEEVEA